MPNKTFRDVIWGDIELKEEEVAIVNSKTFQRLRRIKQLGLADLVYPCAKHTRFDHSLGTLSAAQLMVDDLKKAVEINDDASDYIRYYALLHDISHIPFGHTLEDEGRLYKRHDDGERWRYYISELCSELKDAISPNICDKISNLSEIKNDKENMFIDDIVSNTICADLIDYIQRDGYFTGATSLRFKFDDRIFKFLTLEYDEHDCRRLVFKPIKDKIRIDVITDIIQLLRYRYMITERVTYHHTRCAANAMLIKAIHLLGTPEDEFYWMGDEDVLNYISSSDDENVKEIGERLKYRKLFKIAFRVTRDAAKKSAEGSIKEFSRKYGSPEGREYLEDELIKEFTKTPGLKHFDKNHLAIYCPFDENMTFKETGVMIQWRGSPTQLTNFEPEYKWEQLIVNEVKALENKYQALWNMHIFVHPKYTKDVYARDIERCCKNVLGVENDPLLQISFERQEGYKEAMKYEKRLLSRGIVQRAVEVSAQSGRGGTEDEDEVLNRAILETTQQTIQRTIPQIKPGEVERYEDNKITKKKSKRK